MTHTFPAQQTTCCCSLDRVRTSRFLFFVRLVEPKRSARLVRAAAGVRIFHHVSVGARRIAILWIDTGARGAPYFGFRTAWLSLW